MRRQGNFADSGSNAYGSGQIQHASGQRMDHNSQFQGQLEAFTPEREQPFSDSQAEGQWRWERDRPKVSKPISSSMFNEGEGVDSSRSYYQGQLDPKVGIEKQSSDLRSQPHEENANLGYEDNCLSQTFEGLEQKFLDDIMKLAKEQTEAEDAEIARHREKISAINARYQEKLVVLRARHSSSRNKFLCEESQARQQQYNQQAMMWMDQYSKTGMGPTDEPIPSIHHHNPQGYGGHGGGGVPDTSTAARDAPRSYGSDRFDGGYGEKPRFHGVNRDHGFESRGQYTGGRVYDTGSRYK